MFFFIIWIILTFIVAEQGRHRRIGYAATFFISLFLSPIIGLLIVIASIPKQDKRRVEKETDSDSGFNIDDYRSN